MNAVERVIFEISLPPLRGMEHEADDTLTPLTEAGYALAALSPDGTVRAITGDEIWRTFLRNFVASSPAGLEKRPPEAKAAN